MSVNPKFPPTSLSTVQARAFLAECQQKELQLAQFVRKNFKSFEQFQAELHHLLNLPSQDALKSFQEWVYKELEQGNSTHNFSPSVQRFLLNLKWRKIQLSLSSKSLEDFLLSNSPIPIELDLSGSTLHFEDIRVVSVFLKFLRKLVLNRCLIDNLPRDPQRPYDYDRTKILSEDLRRDSHLEVTWNTMIYFPCLEIFQAENLEYKDQKVQRCWALFSPMLAVISLKGSVGLEDVMVMSYDEKCFIDTDQTWLQILPPQQTLRPNGGICLRWRGTQYQQDVYTLAKECEKRNFPTQFDAIRYLLPGGHLQTTYLENIKEILREGHVWLLKELLLGQDAAKLIKELFLLHEAAVSPLCILEELLRFKDQFQDYPHDSNPAKPRAPIVIAYLEGHLHHVHHLISITPSDTLASLFTLSSSKNARTLLHHTIASNQIGLPEALLQKDPELMWNKDELGITPFHLIMEKRNLELLKYVEISKSSQDRFGWNPLHYAARAGTLEIARQWIASLSPERRSEVLNETTTTGMTPLHVAAEYGHTPFILWLQSKGILLSQPDTQGRNVLWHAVAGGRTALVGEFLQTPDLYQSLPEAHNPFEVAILRRHWMTLRLLIERALPYHRNGRGDFWPLAAVKLVRASEKFQIFLSKGLHPHAREPRYGLTLLHLDIALGDSNRCDEVSQNPAILQAFQSPDGLLLSGVAAFFGERKWLEMLLQHEKPGQIDGRGYHVLHYAILGEQAEVIEWLLVQFKDQLDPLSETSSGENCYILAQRKGNPTILTMLKRHSEKIRAFLEKLKLGQKLYDAIRTSAKNPLINRLDGQIIHMTNTDIVRQLREVPIHAHYAPEGKTLFQLSVEALNVEVVTALLRMGVRCDMLFSGKKTGWTAFHECASRSQPADWDDAHELFMSLLDNFKDDEKVARLRRRDGQGKIPYHYAKANGFKALVGDMEELDPQIGQVEVGPPQSETSSENLDKTEAGLAYLIERIPPAENLALRASFKPDWQYQQSLYLVERTVPAHHCPLPLLLCRLQTSGNYEWNGSITPLAEEGKKQVDFSPHRPLGRAFYLYFHHFWQLMQKGQMDAFDRVLWHQLPYGLLDLIYKSIRNFRATQLTKATEIAQFCQRDKYQEDWKLLIKQGYEPVIKTAELFSPNVHKLIRWLDYMSQKYEVGDENKFWTQARDRMRNIEERISQLLESDKFPVSLCQKLYFERIKSPDYYWIDEDIAILAALTKISFTLVTSKGASDSSPPVPRSNRLLWKNEDGSISFCSFAASIEKPLELVPPSPVPQRKLPIEQVKPQERRDVPSATPPPPQLIQLLQRFEKLEKEIPLSSPFPVDFIRDFQTLWERFPLFESQYLYILQAIDLHTAHSPADRPRLAGQRIFGTLNQFSRTYANGDPRPSSSSGSSCTVNALMFLAYLLPRASLQDLLENSPQRVINQIIDRGRDHFEQLLGRKRNAFRQILQETRLNEGEHEARQIVEEFGGDAISVAEIEDFSNPFMLRLYNLYPRMGSFVLTTDSQNRSSITTQTSPQWARSTTIQFFEQRLREWQDFLIASVQRRSLGAVIHYNGYSYAIAMLRRGEGIEYSIFDSHGNMRLNGTSEAFIYTANSLQQAAQFLGNLVLCIESEAGADQQNDMRRRIAIYHFAPENAP